MKKQSAGAPPKYSDQEKISISREYLTGALGYGLLGRKYGLSKATIIHFVKWYRSNYPEITEEAPDIVPSGTVKVSHATPSALERAKDKELEQARLKIIALELLLTNASKELGIDLVKKPGTKRSNK
mgnify:CR=1 FL=1